MSRAVDLVIRLGNRKLSAEERGKIGPDSVLKLEQQSSEPVDILVGGQLLARGELLVLDGRFSVRVTAVTPDHPLSGSVSAGV